MRKLVLPIALAMISTCIFAYAYGDKPNTNPHKKTVRQSQAAKQKPVNRKPGRSKQAKPNLPRPEAAQPAWIWLDKDGKPADKIFLRQEIVVRGVASAGLYVACNGTVTVYLDGVEVLKHQPSQKPSFKFISSLLDWDKNDGKQILAVEAEASSDEPAGVLVKLDMESGWRDAWSMVSDGSWQASTQAADGWTNPEFKAAGWQQPNVVAQLGGGPWSNITAATLAAAAPLKQPESTPVQAIKALDGFEVELLYSVPKDQEGSWVNMCVDPKGRLIVSDQYGGLYRVTVPPLDRHVSGSSAEGGSPNRAVGGSPDPPTGVKLEKIDVDIGEAQGLLWAFDSLYVVVNHGQKYDSGLYRVRDTDGDDRLDSVETLRKLNGGGEHGPHAILLAPDGKSLYVVCGDGTQLTEFDDSRVPRVWDEDLLLPRCYGRGFMKGTRAPGGYISRIDPDGRQWELVATGFRNEFDAALNAEGELFTFDADMEWDMNTPWYRPTRVCHVVSGAEFGWRNGGGKWPVDYPDSLPPVVNIGPGSPTGISFGYDAKFPAKYQQALFVSDWSYGKLYAVHLKPRGASYTAEFEEFITGTPLPLTDVVVNPHDGAMYFAIGGRRVQSGLYRVTYSGDGSKYALPDRAVVDEVIARIARHELEELHVGDRADGVKIAWPSLNDPDRFIRFAARIAVEHRPLSEWSDQLFAETDPQAVLTATLAFARQFERPDKGVPPDIDTPPPHWSNDKAEATSEPVRLDKQTALWPKIMAKLGSLAWQDLSTPQRIELLRAYTLLFLRIGPPSDERQQLIERFDAVFPSGVRELDSELAQMLVYLQAPTAAAKIVALLDAAPTQEEQIDYAKSLRHLRKGWTPQLQQRYFQWFVRAANYRGGASFGLFVQNIKQDAVANLSAEHKLALKPILEAKPSGGSTPIAAKPRPFVKKWELQQLVPLVENGLRGRDFDRGRQVFAAANCFACHRFDNQGGAVGPDLTALSGRFSPRDILESIVEPSKTISDQYAAVTVYTLDGKVVTGRIVNLAGDSISINTDMLDPNAQVRVDRKQIDEIVPSPLSMMPTGLLDTFDEQEILDLMAYLLSRGDREHVMFGK